MSELVAGLAAALPPVRAAAARRSRRTPPRCSTSASTTCARRSCRARFDEALEAVRGYSATAEGPRPATSSAWPACATRWRLVRAARQRAGRAEPRPQRPAPLERARSARAARRASTTGATAWWRTRSRAWGSGWVRAEPGRKRSICERLRDAYLEVFADLGSHAELVDTLELACRVGKVARALTWHRAISALGWNDVDDDWARGPVESMASLLDASYLGRT